MKGSSEILRVEVSPTIGKVSLKVTAPNKPIAAITFAHGAGAGMEHSFMESLSEALKNFDIATIRFNFPYMENGKKRPDPPAIAERTVEVIINMSHELYPNLPLFVSGKSFGGRMSSQRLSKETPEFVKGIIFVGFPLHPAAEPAITRAAHLSDIKIPMLFLQGTKDALAELTLLEPMVKKLKMATLRKFEGGDHSFKVKGKVVVEELAVEMDRWIEEVMKNKK